MRNLWSGGFNTLIALQAFNRLSFIPVDEHGSLRQEKGQ